MQIYIKRTLLLMRSSVTIFYANKPNHFPSLLVALTQTLLVKWKWIQFDPYTEAQFTPLNCKLVAITPPKILFRPIYSLNYIPVLNHHICYAAVKILTNYLHETHNA